MALTTTLARMAPPTLEDARAAAAVAVDRGAGMVMLFGSVARGEATADSDIDLIVVFDDLGCYDDRYEIKKEIDAAASAATGYEVRAHVTDRAEWRKRSTEVTASFEASLGDDLISLHEAAPETDIDWGKKIKLPDGNLKEAETRFRDVVVHISGTARWLLPNESEIESGDELERLDRMRRLCGESGRAVEAAVKTLVALGGASPEHTHSIAVLLGQMPDRALAGQVEELLTGSGALKLAHISDWHTKSNYADDVETQWAEAENQKAAMVAAAIRCAQMARDHYVAAGGDDTKLLKTLDRNFEYINRDASAALGDETAAFPLW